MNTTHEEDRLSRLRRVIETAYEDAPTGAGSSFGELLCYELHVRGLAFTRLAAKWGLSLPTLGELIWDHCKRLEGDPRIHHEPGAGSRIHEFYWP